MPSAVKLFLKRSYMPGNLLSVENVSASYSSKPVLQEVSIKVDPGEIVLLLGHNGAGKSTVLKVIFGDLHVNTGKITYLGKEISNLPVYKRRDIGMAYLPQSNNIFSDLNVYDNLKVSGNGLRSLELSQRIEETYNIFPVLKNMHRKRAGLLSGGERQMLALGMLLLTRPRLLLLDEPSAGLSPALVIEIMQKIVEINKAYGTAILLVEQKVAEAFKIANRCYQLKNGRVSFVGKPEEMREILSRTLVCT